MSRPAAAPASKQKSCNACVRSKRRCDKRTPRCTRCTAKRMLCVYGGRADLRGAAAEDVHPPPLDLSAPSALVTGAPDLDCFDIGVSLGSTLGLSPLQFDVDFGDRLGNAIPRVRSPNSTPWQDNFLEQNAEIAAAAEVALTMRDYSRMAHICDEFRKFPLVRDMLDFMQSMKNVVPQFATCNCTPFLHRHLYKDSMPQCILQAFSLCVLYTNRTSENRGLILRVLHESVKNLIHSAVGTSLTPQERIARVHALMMYQFVRMFDGDVTLSTQADSEVALLGSWLVELAKVGDNLDEEARMDHAELRGSPPESWERWIFAESLRRTLVFGHSQIVFWNLLKQRQKSEEMGVWTQVFRWTLSASLWNATNSFDFFQAWKEKPFWVISGFDFSDFLTNGSGDDMDELARIFMTIYFGVSEMKTFCLETARSRNPWIVN